jgi:hypothetical protein
MTNRLHANIIKVRTDWGSVFVQIDTDRACTVEGFAVATPQKLENTAIGGFLDQLKYEAEGAAV